MAVFIVFPAVNYRRFFSPKTTVALRL